MILLGYTLSAAFSVLGLALAARYRSIPGAYAFMALCALTGLAALSSSMEYSAPLLVEAKLLWRNVQQISYFLTPVAVFSIAATYSMYGDKLTPRRIALLTVIPAAALALLFTNDWHHLMRSAVTLDETGRLAIERTPLNGLFLFYLFLLNLVSLLLLLRTALFMRGAQRRQVGTLLFAVALPSVISLLRTVGAFPITGYGASIAITYLPGSVVMLWGIFKYQLLEVVPLSRNKLVDALEEGVVVCDPETRVLDMNEAAKRMLGRLSGRTMEAMQGRRLSDALPSAELWLQAHYAKREQVVELASGLGEQRLCLSVKVMPLTQGEGRFTGTMSVLTDTTSFKRQVQELRRDAAKDELTGVYNRNGFGDRAAQQIAAARAMEQPLSLLIIEVDGLRSVNDTLGHRAGDETIRAAARAMAQQVDRAHLMGRTGGAQFAVLLAGVPDEQAAATGETIRRGVELAMRETAESAVPLRVEAGIACRGSGDADFEALYAAAYRRLRASMRRVGERDGSGDA
ncbi:diguanylate cyclase [Paenibacillus sp. TRM 82003]|nr:diguanylate cyclase [Paenibacillus sp. TRM 82003]